MKRRLALLVALLAVAAGTATGIALAVRGSSGLSSAAARAQFARFEKRWRAELRAGARSDPRRRFPSPPRSWLSRRLRDAATLCDCFRPVGITFLHPRQVAPVVVVEAGDEHAFFERQAAIFDLIEDYSPARHRGMYEGFLLEAVDHAGVPFLAVDLFLRGTRYGGSDFWAVPSLERLVPRP